MNIFTATPSTLAFDEIQTANIASFVFVAGDCRFSTNQFPVKAPGCG
jgi:hypothetical protein